MTIIVSAASRPFTLSYNSVTLLMPRNTARRRNLSVGYLARAAVKYARNAAKPTMAPAGLAPIV